MFGSPGPYRFAVFSLGAPSLRVRQLAAGRATKFLLDAPTLARHERPRAAAAGLDRWRRNRPARVSRASPAGSPAWCGGSTSARASSAPLTGRQRQARPPAPERRAAHCPGGSVTPESLASRTAGFGSQSGPFPALGITVARSHELTWEPPSGLSRTGLDPQR